MKIYITPTIIFSLILTTLYTKVQLVLALNSVLDINGTFPYLIDPKTGKITEPKYYMDFDNIYAPNETYKINQNSQGRSYHLLKAFDFANYYQADYWRYSNKEDLRLSAFPVANSDKCAKQLDWLESKLNDSENLFKSGNEHISLMTLIDSFGRPESNTYLGKNLWLGSYYECIRVSIDMGLYEQEESCNNISSNVSTAQRIACHQNQNKQINNLNKASSETSGNTIIKGRYCLGKAHDKDWPTMDQDNYSPRIAYKLGMCLPETCETLSIEKHRDQLERLMKFNMPDYMKKRISLHDLYCLPDPRSPIRSLSLPSRIFLIVNGIWILGLIVATIVYSCVKTHQRDLKDILINTHQNQNQNQNHIHHHLNHHHCHHLNHHNSTQMVFLSRPNEDSKLNYHHHHHHPHQQHHHHHHSIDSSKKIVESKLIVSTCSNDINEDDIKKSTLLLSPHKQTNIKEQEQFQITIDKSENPVEKHINHLNLKQSTDQLSTNSYKSSSASLAAWLSESPKAIKIIRCLSLSENLKEFSQPPALLRQTVANQGGGGGSSNKLRINLNALDFIKCLCCVMVIFGHIVFIHMQHNKTIMQSIELSYGIPPRILIGFFNFVDTFFIISGMLTAYFIFKRFNVKTFGKPLIWFYVSLLRIIRLSPIYILIFWFTKTISVYLYDGPIWDYGTDKNSIRGLCINDSWWKSILYLGNLGTMQPLCILPAWSIIVDSQYSLVIPPILYLILRHKRLGYLLLFVATVISTAKMSLQLATQTAVKTSDMAKISFHVYPLISRFAAEFYNTAWNRMGPVAIGIIGGHMLYLYDIGKIRRWPWFMRDFSFKIVLAMHLFIFIMPTIGKFTDDPTKPQQTGATFTRQQAINQQNINNRQTTDNFAEPDLTVFLISNATIKPIWSIINTILLLRLITDLRKHSVWAKLASHNIWHCLGKLCFISYLAHYEIILIILKSSEDGHLTGNWSSATKEFSLVFLISTTLAYVIYIFYEAPINKLINLVMSKPDYSAKGSTSGQSNNQIQTNNNISNNNNNNSTTFNSLTTNGCSKPF